MWLLLIDSHDSSGSFVILSVNSVSALCCLRNLRKVYKWMERENRWKRVCKAATVQVINGQHDNPRGNRMIRIQEGDGRDGRDGREEGTVHFQHVFPRETESLFRAYKDRKCCSWLIAKDEVQPQERLNVSVVFRTITDFEQFVRLFTN